MRGTPCSATRSPGCSTSAGHTVEREYYFNDAGGQMDRFGASVEARYLQLLGRDAEVPEDGYHGDYIAAYAEDIVREHGDALADLPDDERFVRLRAEGARRAMEGIRATLARFNVVFDSFRLRGVAGGRRRDRRGDRAAARRRSDLRGRRRGLVPLHRLRRRQGPHRRALQRPAHVLRRRPRLRDRQVPPRFRPPDLRLGRRSSRRRRAGQGGGRRHSGSTPIASSCFCTNGSRSCGTVSPSR